MTAVESSKRTGANTDVATMSNKLNNSPMEHGAVLPSIPRSGATEQSRSLAAFSP